MDYVAEDQPPPAKKKRIRAPKSAPRGFKTLRRFYKKTDSYPDGRDVIVKAEWSTLIGRDCQDPAPLCTKVTNTRPWPTPLVFKTKKKTEEWVAQHPEYYQ